MGGDPGDTGQPTSVSTRYTTPGTKRSRSIGVSAPRGGHLAHLAVPSGYSRVLIIVRMRPSGDRRHRLSLASSLLQAWAPHCSRTGDYARSSGSPTRTAQPGRHRSTDWREYGTPDDEDAVRHHRHPTPSHESHQHRTVLVRGGACRPITRVFGWCVWTSRPSARPRCRTGCRAGCAPG